MNGICVPSRGKSGGLALLLSRSVNVLLQQYSHNHIDVSVQLDDKLDWWHFTGIYGEPDTSKRERTWNLLTRLRDQSNRAWLCAGDFNEILGQSEKFGDRLARLGNSETSKQRHSAPTTVRERLDRACANSEWTHLFPDVSVTHEPMNCSDHAALIIHLTDTPEFHSHTARPWHSEAAWLQSDQCALVVGNSWVTTLGNIQETGLTEQIACCQTKLKLWSATAFGVDKTQTLYASNRPSRNDIAEGTEHLRTIIDASMRAGLLQPYTAAEVKTALFQIAPLKSLGPDANPRQGWMALKLDVSKAYDKNAKLEQRLRGIMVCRGGASISHFIFADDTLIFCQPSTESSQTIHEVLETYRGASGQEINFSKSSVAFSRNTKEELCQSIAGDLTIRRENKI
ncbi:hypothetical protein Sango_2936600 [Sesamum angolense]|uniref:Endonuclease/exonuclease/phosphatase domain-containing protein n=1 Tax=Sesamum angolense TaxID=2727404 RepID=A0AAE1VV78_9LAMI|nr:hypothetical protein Sango_2936600 [Sesamum angolense]